MPKTVELTSLPGVVDLYPRAVSAMLPVIGKPGRVRADATIPDTVFTIEGLKVDQHKLGDYCLATGQQFGETLPLTYPFVLQFPLAMSVMVASDFPFGAVGSVHIGNTIHRYRPIGVTEPLNIRTHAENLREHRKGMLVDMVSRVSVGGEVVTEQIATFLKQQRTSLSDSERGPAPKSHRPPPPDRVVSVDQGLTRRYAEASGDRNPIHMSGISAMAFGFPKAIAHGMWSAAAALANLEGQVPGDVTYAVRFGKPILLPSRVYEYTTQVDGGFDISLLDRKKGSPFLTGTLRG
ncbi:MaoC/PaaZ C-terminal domain-containing protein [Williamsia sterculiae]|uniref:MaoC like domain-containing protein n=1 Tax=Williamsia sterculiae TaxID=1344003 RepID=A0A1N7CEM4_9NOCA|nr:MaoC/PaaZ C-terminal domain-containing protein [Williamsia sterculiae]SIR62029.1 MaoC like domain-containing protein [Williamsia sterculiae]